MKQSLYQIEKEYRELAAELIENGGEVTEEQEKALQITQEQLQTKAVNYGFVIKQIDGEVSMIDAEIKRLQGLKKSRVNSIQRLKDTLSNAMTIFEIDEIKTPLITVNFRKSKSVKVNVDDLPDNCVIIERKPISKTEIKKKIESGEEITGAELVTNRNIQIK